MMTLKAWKEFGCWSMFSGKPLEHLEQQSDITLNKNHFSAFDKSEKEIILVVQGENDSKLNVVRGKELCGFMVYFGEKSKGIISGEDKKRNDLWLWDLSEYIQNDEIRNTQERNKFRRKIRVMFRTC